MRIISFPLILIAIFSQISFAQNQLWIDREARYSFAYSMSADNENNVCVTGNCLIDTFAGNSQSMVAIKYNPNGNREWTYFGGIGCSATDIKYNSSGFFYIVGYCDSGLVTWKLSSSGAIIWRKNFIILQFIGNYSSPILSIDNNSNIYVVAAHNNIMRLIKYDQNGIQLWAKSFGLQSSVNIPHEITFDKFNNSYIACNYNNQYSVLKFNSNGDSVWCSSIIDIGTHGEVNSLKILNDFLFATGTVYTSNFGNETLTTKYDLNGNLIWRQRYIDQNYHRSIGNKLILDNSFDCIIIGDYGKDLIVLKYDTLGNLKWTQSYGNSYAVAIAIDKQNSIYVSGCGRNPANAFDFDYLTLKYNSEGSLNWSVRYNGNANYSDVPMALVLDKIGNVYVTGISWSNNDNIATIKYSSTTGISNNSFLMPENFILSQNYPNPFNPNTKFNYELRIANYIEINLYDVNGRLIKILESGYKRAGSYEINFSGEGLSSGIYYYSLYADGILIDTKKSIIIK